jgi:polysaccharide deacetylase 2 family uncharacterized protein YibQ
LSSTKHETGNLKLETGNSKQGKRIVTPQFRVSNLPAQVGFEFRAWDLRLRTLFLLLLLATSACNWFHPQPKTEADRRNLAGRFKNLVEDAGGAQIWIKRPAQFRRGRDAGTSLQVVATPGGYRAVLVAVQRESDQDKLDLETTGGPVGAGRPEVDLNVSQRGQRIIQIHLREVPRLLRGAIVIDDMGHDLGALRKLLALAYPLTFSVLPRLRYSQVTAEEVHRSGREVLLHLPMEPEPGAHVSPGEGAIFTRMSEAEVERTIQLDLTSVPYVAGVNNHMGSRATQDAVLMAGVMKVLAGRGLYFIDSRTTAESKALAVARREGLPAFYRSVFLDGTETVPYTLAQLREFRHVVEREGVALAIGHPHPTTISALGTFLPELERADIELVPPSEIVRLPEVARLSPRAVTSDK